MMQNEIIKVGIPGSKTIQFDGQTLTLQGLLRDTVTIPVQQVAAIDVPGPLHMTAVAKIRTTDGRQYKFPFGMQRKKMVALRDAVMAAH